MTSETTLLTQREWEVVQCVAQGMRNDEIAKALYIAQGTVASTLNKIYKKLGIAANSQFSARIKLVAMYYKGEIAPSPERKDSDDQ